ncbi:MAG: nucleotidyltransferase [Terriglobales bacterium]
MGTRADELPVTSSVPVKLPEAQETLFREVLLRLEEERLPFTISGAVALQQHTGICRFTKDLDIFLSPADANAALPILARQGFECEVQDPVWLAKARRDGFFVDLITGMSNGAITVDAEWIKRSHPAVVLGVETRVLAPEELIASKLFITRRERFDGADIVHVIYALGGRLDWQRILELAGEHWELVLWALVLFRYVYPAQTNYVPQTVWTELLGRFAKEVQLPSPNARFRGSLIDDKMFAIDVEEWGLDDILKENQARRVKIKPI